MTALLAFLLGGGDRKEKSQYNFNSKHLRTLGSAI